MTKPPRFNCAFPCTSFDLAYSRSLPYQVLYCISIVDKLSMPSIIPTFPGIPIQFITVKPITQWIINKILSLRDECVCVCVCVCCTLGCGTIRRGRERNRQHGGGTTRDDTIRLRSDEMESASTVANETKGDDRKMLKCPETGTALVA